MSSENIETVTYNVSANHQFREVAKMIPHEEVAVSKMETTTPTREKSSAVGNAAAMREREAGAEAAHILEMLDSKINEIESMKDAPLDGCFYHQEQNGQKLCAKLDFYEFAKRILSAMQ